MIQNELDFLSASFISKQKELLYRKKFLANDRRQRIIGLLLLCTPLVTFLYSDYVLFGNSSEFYYMLVIRITCGFFIALTIYFLMTSENIHKTDILVFFTLVIVVSVTLLINLSRPSDYFQHTTLDNLILFSLYCLIPNRYFLQIIPAIMLSLFNIYVFTFHKAAAPTLTTTIFWFSYLFVNATGLWVSWNLHTYRRRQFATELKQIETMEKLKQANKEIKTLQGILPLCSGCKKIRDDQGYWSQLEAYIENNTDTKFSHGMCASCIETLYGDQEWYQKSKNKQKDFIQYSSES